MLCHAELYTYMTIKSQMRPITKIKQIDINRFLLLKIKFQYTLGSPKVMKVKSIAQ